ncbi:hypothetical protein Misp01_64920 [Microtetraspora sp. NBRC 13810]|uniref:hypothetical protein n=1 Tax=Microtetraspora sp. NBRC 13810 TaxID=3030990 RepID=UPI0024A2503B|nr:hypothetical protein [Microtetraspora sp. NBRC 13810]GLW11364.1 hypothetical protein Misp01_64920 [Microtetraspora sp. NBRC 13810]
MRPTLVVPVTLDALVITTAVKGENAFRIWTQSYTALQGYGTPEPDEGDRQVEAPRFTDTGVHLHWTLPRGLRHGVQDPQTGEVRFPPVPNRWLLTRFSGTTSRQVKAWVIESDCPHSTYARQHGHDDSHSSDFVIAADTVNAWQASTDPYRSAARPRNPEPGSYQVPIGLAFPIQDAQSWTERAAGDPLYLTAIGAANPYFPSYTPHNSNIFSFVDDLADLTAATTLGYHVIGWYSRPDADILAAPPQDTSYAGLLAHLDWQDPRLTGDADHDAAVEPATRSLYAGHALTVTWDPGASAAPATDPLRQIRDNGKLDAAIANTTEDAFVALAGRALDGTTATPTAADMQLLRAFLYDLLPLAEEKGGDERVRRSIHNAWFGASSGGYSWTVTPSATTGDTPQPVTTPDWLDTLNDDQRRLDAQLGELASLQWRLNALWLKNGICAQSLMPPDDAPEQQQMEDELDPGRDGSLAQTVRRKTTEARDQAAKVPQPDTSHADPQDALLAGIDAFAQAKGLAPGATLKALPQPPYWQSNNPVITLSGITPPPDATVSDEPLLVRPVTDDLSTLISSVTVRDTPITATPGQGPMPGVPIQAALPETAGELLAEYFLLDPGNAPALAAATGLPADEVTATLTAHRPADYTGTLPALGLVPWQQPWQPLFMEWRAYYVPIPYAVGTQRCWTFDGTDYRFTPGEAVVDPATVEIRGISGLGPHPRELFASRLKKFVADHGTADQRAQLEDWLTAIGDWGFLAQELTGFNERLAARDTRAFRRPTPGDPGFPQIAELAGYPDAATADGLPARYRGRVTTAPYLPQGASAPFQETRQGQIYLRQLFLYDKFGRVLDVVNPDPEGGGLHDYRNFPLVIDDALATETSLLPSIASVAQLPPRPLQPARLDFDLLDGMTGSRVVGTDAELNPVGGWVLPNHLDHSLLLYDPTGRLLGTYRLLVTQDGRLGQWEPPPDGGVTTLDQVAALAPVVAGLIRSPRLAPEAGFTAFLDVIDSTLWTSDPLGTRADQNLSVLIGRPLALVPAQLRLRLDGAPIFDTGWAATLSPPPPSFTGDEFAVRLGDQLARDDGLIGYFGTDSQGGYRYDSFNSVATPDGQQDYVTQIGPLGPCATPSAANYLQLTFGDPAPTRVLLLMDPRAGVHAITGITPAAEISVPSGHVEKALARIEALFRFGPVVTTRYPQSIAFPRPSEKQGGWSWLLPAPGNAPWTSYPLTPALPNAQFPDAPTTLQDGLLRFTADLEEHTDPS